MARPANAATGSRISRRCSPPIRRWRNPTRCSGCIRPRRAARAIGSSPGVSPADVRFDNLLYADTAIRSYARFRQAQAPGRRFRRMCRFQVDLVPAHSVIWLFLQDDLHAPVDPIFNAGTGARDRPARRRHPARRARDPVRRGVCGVRAAAAQRAVTPMAATAARCSRPSARSWPSSRTMCPTTSS